VDRGGESALQFRPRRPQKPAPPLMLTLPPLADLSSLRLVVRDLAAEPSFTVRFARPRPPRHLRCSAGGGARPLVWLTDLVARLWT